MNSKKVTNANTGLTAGLRGFYKRYFEKEKPIRTLEYIGELVEKFKWVDPLKLDHAIISTDYPDSFNGVEFIKFPLEKGRKDITKRIKLNLDFDFITATAYEMDGFSATLEEYEKVYNDESRIEHYIEHQVIPAIVSIKMDRTGAYDWLMIQMEESADNLCQMLYDLERDGFGTPDRAKEKVFEFLRIFVETTERVRAETDRIETVTQDAEVKFYTETADFELKYLKAFVLRDSEAQKDLYQ